MREEAGKRAVLTVGSRTTHTVAPRQAQTMMRAGQDTGSTGTAGDITGIQSRCAWRSFTCRQPNLVAHGNCSLRRLFQPAIRPVGASILVREV